jgi:hypothetical protein
MLNQPDPQKFVNQAREIADRAERASSLARKQLLGAEIGAAEFINNGEFSQQTCEAMNERNLKIDRKLADLSTRNAILRGYSWYFLNEGMSEGDGSPCDC